MPDFISKLKSPDPTVGLHDGLVALYDALLASAALTQPQKEIIAQLRAKTDIALKGL